jgi:hypothetical protein
MTSLWQTNAVAIRVVQTASWRLIRNNAVSWIDGYTTPQGASFVNP